MFCVCPAPAYWDTAEAQAVPWIFGIMHPTGFPVFTIFAGMFAHAIPFGTVAWRIGAFSALALTAAAWLIARSIVLLDGDPWIACAAAWLFAFGEFAWTRGTRAEVHALATFFGIAAVYTALRFLCRGKARDLLWCAAFFGLGIATHPIVALLLPAILLVLLERLRSLRFWSTLAAAAVFLAGLGFYAYLPLRSAAVYHERLDPTLQLGIPPGRSFWDNDHPSSRSGFLREAGGEEYGAGGTFARMVRLDTYENGLPQYLDDLFEECTPVAIGFTILGFAALWRRDDYSSMVLLLAFSVPTAFALAYTIETDPHRYFLIGYGVVAIVAGAGASWLKATLRAPQWIAAVLACVTAASMLFINRGTFDQRTSSGSQAVIDSAVKKTPDNAVLITPWLTAGPLAYGAYVERELGNRIVETAWLNDDRNRVPAWTKTRRVFVVGRLFGEPPQGYTIVPVPDSEIYEIVRLPLARHLH